jgi:hypothetical protein
MCLYCNVCHLLMQTASQGAAEVQGAEDGCCHGWWQGQEKEVV